MKHKLNERIKNFNITILISLFLLLSCGSGQQPQAGKDGEAATGGSSLSAVLMEVGRSAENAFYSFLELLSDTLGFTVTKDTTKNQVGDYFNSLGVKLGEASKELEKLAKISETDVDKGGLLNKAIKEAVDAAKTTLNTLKGHLESLKNIGDANQKVVGEVASQQNGVAAADGELKNVYKALKGIVEIANTEGIEKLKESNLVLNQASIGIANPENGAKVLTAGANAGGASGPEATAIVSAVSGEEILDSIVKSKDTDVKALVGNAVAGTTPLEFAKGTNNTGHLAQAAVKAAAVAGGIALRSLVKDGKLASNNNNDEKAVQSAGISAVNKLLVAVEDIIKKTVKKTLEKVKQDVDKARDPKPVG
ncbi:variable large family protein [Borrelia turicatae]|uniref:variable large family protein n=1 Tax=Borrelia turicatae TaxID=142 RepID=UPI001FF57C34|nr:variable large family protein [Borrelia turicatae]UPA14312.1 variable large family protein [Borrelia turicatae 91E135]